MDDPWMLALAACFVVPLFGGFIYLWLGRRTFTRVSDEFDTQAQLDQQKADYPGCAAGLMHCRSFCECTNARRPSFLWVERRAEILRRRAICVHENIGPRYHTLFAMLGPRGQECRNCGQIRDDENSPWREKDD